MANKQLTAKVRLNITDAENKLKRLNTLFRNLDKASNSVGTNKKVEQQLTKNQNKVQNIVSKVKQWAVAQHQVTTAAKSTNGILGAINNKVKMLASTYLGILGMKAAITTSDLLTGTQNKLNNLNGGNKELTQNQMDKMYTSANKVRMAYTDMAANASKSMTLAGDAFQGNMDNAIRFQEIMAETYTLGGASAEEMSTSMYQMIQALGAGTLAGDELRSVREGAPLAYKAIEEFAQGVYNTTDSLKDMAAQGLITSEMVVAAVMDAGDRIDKQFENTAMTFGQAWNRIKSAAVKAFEPVSNAMNEMLNRAAKNGVFEKIEQAFWNISKVIQIVFALIEKGIMFVIDNWDWLKYVVLGVLTVIIALMMKKAAVAVATAAIEAAAWIKANWGLLLIVGTIMAILYCFEQLKNGTIAMTEFLIWCALIVATAFLIAGIIMGSIPMLIIAGVLALLAIMFMFFEQICGAVTWTGMLFKNVGLAVANFFIAIGLWVYTAFMNCIEWIVTAFNNAVNWIRNFGLGLWNSLKAIAQNIGIAFENAWIAAQNAFWSFIRGCLEGVRYLEPAINAIAKAFGAEGFTLSGVIDGVASKQKAYKSYVSVGDAWSSGYNTYGYESGKYNSLSEAWKNGMSTFDVFQDGWGSDAYNVGAKWGAGVKDSINEWGSQFQGDGSSSTGLLDEIGNKLGLNLSGGFPSATDPAYNTAGAYNMPENLKATADNTGDMADSMDLAEEDLAYLRKIAEMEWKKEYTTASITVDMSNYNTINGESDLDGIVTKLSDKLREELSVVANGVYA